MHARLPRRSALPLMFLLLTAGAWVASACADRRPSSATGTVRPDTVSDTIPTTVPGDSLALADSARRTCGGLREEAKERCYGDLFATFVARHGVRVAMGALNRLGMMDSYIHNNGGHGLAHSVGITAGRADGDLSRTFTGCTEIFQSGCYHGVIQARFERVREVNPSVVNAVCEPWASPAADQWLHFQCAHGMGHGLTTFYAHDLRRALEGCDLLREDWDRESCYGGAFMENVVNATSPHHHTATSPRIGPAGAHHGHDSLRAASGRPAFKPIDPNDMQYPCSALAERYWRQCYQMQTSVMLHFTNDDIAATAHLCQQAPGVMRYVCHQSLGRDIIRYTGQYATDVVRKCSLAAPEYQPWCHVGAVANFIDVTAKAEDGIAYCREVPGDRNKALCYHTVGEEIAVLRAELTDREALCGKVEERWREVCRYGAQLQTARPPIIPQPKAG